MIRFDHIAIAAATLEQGADYVAKHTGLHVPIGGQHPLMATHNRVMATGADTFFEIIAPDPGTQKPNHNRWFGLDQWQGAARPHAWVLHSDDLDRDLAIAAAFGVDFGTPLALSRGDLSWRFAVRKDGAIPLGGAAPMLMQWPDMPAHPAAAMPDLGARILAAKIQSPHGEALKAVLAAMGGDIAPVEISKGPNLKISVTLILKSGRKVTL